MLSGLQQRSLRSATSAYRDRVAVPYLKTVSDIVNGVPVSILRFLPRGNHSAILAGTSTRDMSAKVQTAVNAASRLDFTNCARLQCDAIVAMPAANRWFTGYGGRIDAQHATSIFRQRNRGYEVVMVGMTFTGKAKAFHYDAQDLPVGPAPFAGQYKEYTFRDVKFLQDATTEAVYLYGPREGRFFNCNFETNKGIYSSFAIEVQVYGCDFKNCARNIFSDTGSEGLKIYGGSSLGATIGLEAKQNANITINGVLWDYADQNILIRGCSEILISSAYLGTRTSNPAIEFALATAVRNSRIKIVGSEILTNYNNAAAIAMIADSVDNLTLAESDVWNWQSVGFQYSNSTNVRIRDNDIIPKAGTGTYSISCIGAQDANDQIEGNYLGKPVNGITNKKIAKNTGGIVITENGGTDTVANGTTSKVVTHGLSFTPDPQNIDVVFVTQGTNNYGRWWIGTITATQFTVFVTADPGAGGAAFYWKARVRT